MPDFTKVIQPAVGKTYNGRAMPIFCKIIWQEGRLSITGVEGPLRSGNALGGRGQITTNLRETLDDLTYNEGWDRDKMLAFLAIWSRWHLNHLNSGTARQEACLDTFPEDVWREEGHRSHYDWALRVLEKAGLNPCPDTGHRYGTAWVHEDVPEEVIACLRALPETSVEPAWV